MVAGITIVFIKLVHIRALQPVREQCHEVHQEKRILELLEVRVIG